MVKEEEEKDLEEEADGELRKSHSVGTFQLPPPIAKTPASSTSGMSAVEALSQRRARRKKAMFSLQVNDLVSHYSLLHEAGTSFSWHASGAAHNDG